MKNKFITCFLAFGILTLTLMACASAPSDSSKEASAGTPQPTEAPASTAAPAPTEAPAPTATPAPTKTPATPAPTDEPQATEAPASADLQKYKVMCWGDSITAGWCQGSREHQFGGYRIYLTSLLETNGYSESIDFVGKWTTGTGYDMDNSGTNGATIAHDYEWADSMLTDLNNGILTTYNPDIILLQIGTNDINNQTEEEENLSISNINERLEGLVDATLSQMDETDMLFVASIPFMQGKSAHHNMNVAKYNSFIKKMCEEKGTEGYHISFVDVNSVVKNDQFDDDLHPNQSGYESIGNLWYEVLTEYISE